LDYPPTVLVLSRNSSRGYNSNRVSKKTYNYLSFSYRFSSMDKAYRFSSMDKDREKATRNYSQSAKEVFQKYFNMIKPFYEKFS
jgi:hypothetical protein